MEGGHHRVMVAFFYAWRDRVGVGVLQLAIARRTIGEEPNKPPIRSFFTDVRYYGLHAITVSR